MKSFEEGAQNAPYHTLSKFVLSVNYDFPLFQFDTILVSRVVNFWRYAYGYIIRIALPRNKPMKILQ